VKTTQSKSALSGLLRAIAGQRDDQPHFIESNRRRPEIAADLDRAFHAVMAQVNHSTMLPAEALRFTWRTACQLIQADLPGVFVECGTWLGGCSFGLALVQKQVFGRVVRPVLMLDSFEGLPPATTRDGPAAIEYQIRTEAPGYFDNCRASMAQVERIRASLGLTSDECRLIPGWFETTVRPLSLELGEVKIALLRVDCDWYDPVKLVLETLTPLVEPEGVVILDDYYAWDGAARAAHDYLSGHSLAYRIRQIGQDPDPVGAWFRKRQARQLGGPL
jgi:O-methyltransferase